MDLDLDPAMPRTAHLVGICGAGMKALAEFLHDRGWRLSGSDLTVPERVAGHFSRRCIPVSSGHSPAHVTIGTELLIYSPAAGDGNPERLRAAELGIPQKSYVEFLAALTRRHSTICVAGTHGKSTTTAMLGTILQSAGRDPSVICGAESIDDGVSGRFGEGEWLVLESCEYRGHFLQYRPKLAVITGIDADHFDCFQEGDATEAFVEFASRVPREGTVVSFASLPSSRRHLQRCSARVVEFTPPTQTGTMTGGRSEVPGWSAAELRPEGTGIWFRVLHDGEECGVFHLNVPGEHNVANALAAIAAAHSLGLAGPEIFEGLERFRGLRRRFEVRRVLGTTFVDDYAHHPTAIRLLLKTARDVFPGRKLRCVFQPHQLSRTKMLLHQFADSFALADELLILPVFPAREQKTDEHFTASREMVRLACNGGTPATSVGDLDHLARTLETSVTSQDLVLTIGAGDIDRLYHEFA